MKGYCTFIPPGGEYSHQLFGIELEDIVQNEFRSLATYQSAPVSKCMCILWAFKSACRRYSAPGEPAELYGPTVYSKPPLHALPPRSSLFKILREGSRRLELASFRLLVGSRASISSVCGPAGRLGGVQQLLHALDVDDVLAVESVVRVDVTNEVVESDEIGDELVEVGDGEEWLVDTEKSVRLVPCV